MLEKLRPLAPNEPIGPQLSVALNSIGQIILEGLRHGHFSCRICIEIGKNNRRHLVIEAGKSHKFTIPEEELPRWNARDGDP